MTAVLLVAGVVLLFIGAVPVIGGLVLWPALLFVRKTPRDIYAIALSLACLPAGLFLLSLANGVST